MRRLILLLAAAAALSAAQNYRVAGVIVHSESGSPIANASVSLALTTGSRGDMLATTGPDGRFAFDAPRGVYRLSATVAGSSQGFGEASPFADMGCAVITGPDQDTAHLVFRWFRSAVVAGRVLDDQGEPVENARVELLHSGVAEGHARVALLYEAQTNDRGEYRIWGVPGASYYVTVTAQPWYGNFFPAHSREPQAPLVYGTMYYPGATDAARATPLLLRPGEEAHADFTLALISTATVTVNCDEGGEAPPAQPRPGMRAALITHGPGGVETVAQAGFGHCPLAVNGVLPGHYLVRLSDTEAVNPRSGQRWIDVGAGDLSVSVNLRPAAALSGKVTLRNGGNRPGGMMVRVFREPENWPQETTVGADGSFSFPHIDPGKYNVLVSGGGYHAETIRAGETALSGGVLNVEDGVESRLGIVANNEVGHMKGFATRDDQPVANMLVVLVPRNPASADPIQGYQTDSDGSFDWPAIHAGDYLLFAVDDLTIAYADPKTVQPYLPQAKSIRIEPDKVLEERVAVQPAAK